MTSTATRRRIEGIRPAGKTVTARVADGEENLTEASPMALITAHAALTHRIHECKGSQVAGQCDGPCTTLRAQRDLVQAEMLRRMGGQ